MIGLWITLGVVVLLGLWVMSAYNRLVALREQVRAAWAQIDVMLKRRHDLIPNLVETVKGYASHEKETLDRVISARNQAVQAAGNPGKAIVAEGALTAATRQLFALAESYPDLKANTNFLQLQNELADTENGIAGHRGRYNDLVAQYNTSMLSFPTNFVAGPFGFTAQPFFEIQDAQQREAPVVKF